MRSILLILLMASSSAFAENWYAGVGVGAERKEVDPAFRDTGLSLHVDVGRQLNEHVAVEVSLERLNGRKTGAEVYSAKVGIVPRVRIGESTYAILNVYYTASKSDDWSGQGEFDTGFGAGIGVMHYEGNMYLRAGINTDLDNSTDTAGVELGFGWTF